MANPLQTEPDRARLDLPQNCGRRLSIWVEQNRQVRIKIWRLEFAAKDPDNLAKQFSLIFRGNKPINGCAPFHAVAALRQRQDFMIRIRSYRPPLQKLLIIDLTCRSFPWPRPSS